MKYDLIIVGSGSVGAAAGCYAAQADLKVLMIDSGHPPHDQGSHHGDTRLMRHAYGEGEKYVPLALRAQKLWDDLAATTGVEVFQKQGVLNLGPENSSFIRNVISSAEKFSLPIEKLSGPAVTARWPAITVPVGNVGVFEPDAGVLMSEVGVDAYIRLAKRAGCTQLFNCRVTDIRPSSGDVTVVTERGEYSGKKLVVCAGTWVAKLLPELPVVPVRKTFAWHAAGDNIPPFTALTHEDFYYGIPAGGGQVKIGKHNGGQRIESPEQRVPYGVLSSDETELVPFLREFLPNIGPCDRGKACTYAMSPDEDFIIDVLPRRPNILVVAGLSGHGFKFAPALGEIASQFALGQKSKFDLSPFALSRFKKASKY